MVSLFQSARIATSAFRPVYISTGDHRPVVKGDLTAYFDGRKLSLQINHGFEGCLRDEGRWSNAGSDYALSGGIIIDFPSLGITYNGGWCSATKTR